MPFQGTSQVASEDEEPLSGADEPEQGRKQRRKTAYAKQVHKRLGKLLQAGGHEDFVEGGRQMAPQKDTGNLLETVEEGQDKVPNDKAVQPAEMEGAWTGQLPKGDMESGTNAEPNPHK